MYQQEVQQEVELGPEFTLTWGAGITRSLLNEKPNVRFPKLIFKITFKRNLTVLGKTASQNGFLELYTK